MRGEAIPHVKLPFQAGEITLYCSPNHIRTYGKHNSHPQMPGQNSGMNAISRFIDKIATQALQVLT